MKNFKNYQALLSKSIDRTVKRHLPQWQQTHPWAKDCLTRLAEYATRGKMIRGSLVLLAAGKVPKTQSLPVATAIELMHSGLLIQDDVMDRDLQRRGLDTVHHQYQQLSGLSSAKDRLHYGESMANCVAAVSYFLAMGQFAKVKNEKQGQLLELFSQEMAMLGMSQMEDVDTAAHVNQLSKQTVFRIYEQKTGRYTFAVPLLAGLILADKLSARVKNQVLALAKELGIIFQLQDDILGVLGSSQNTGKSQGGDIRERKKTWLYFALLESLPGADKKKLLGLYSQQKQLNKTEQLWVHGKILQAKVMDLAALELQQHHNRAKNLIKKLPFDKEQHEAMNQLLNYLLKRDK